MLMRPGHLSLDELQAIHAGGHRCLIDPQALPPSRPAPPWCSGRGRRRAGLRRQHRLWQAGQHAHRRHRPGTLQWNLIRSATAWAWASRWRPGGAADAGAEGRQPGAGHSGVRPVVIDTLLAVHNAGLVPFVPSQGSVGASGDLALLSHMTLALMGEASSSAPTAAASPLLPLAGARHRAARVAGQRKGWR